MNITLPEDLAPLVQRRAEAGGFESPEAYVASLIQADDFEAWWATLTPEQQQEHERIEQLLTKSLNSGPPIVADEAYWEAKRQQLREMRPKSPLVRVHPDGDREIDAQADYYADRGSPDTADRWHRQTETTFQHLALRWVKP